MRRWENSLHKNGFTSEDLRTHEQREINCVCAAGPTQGTAAHPELTLHLTDQTSIPGPATPIQQRHRDKTTAG